MKNVKLIAHVPLVTMSLNWLAMLFAPLAGLGA
jgi:hypothetical protein